jgi:hypothetical protein
MGVSLVATGNIAEGRAHLDRAFDVDLRQLEPDNLTCVLGSSRNPLTRGLNTSLPDPDVTMLEVDTLVRQSQH